MASRKLEHRTGTMKLKMQRLAFGNELQRHEVLHNRLVISVDEV
jgi:hypothetical protein